jgi:hypothetical protein
MTYGGTTIISGSVLQTTGTLSNPVANPTSAAGTITMVASSGTVLTGTNVLNLAPGLLTGGGTLTLGSTPIWRTNSGNWVYTGELTIVNGGTLRLSSDGTLIIPGTNSGGQSDGTIPEPASALVISIASMALALQRGCSFQRA